MMSYLDREINEQPVTVERQLRENSALVAQVVAAIREFDPIFVSIAARGTSDNAARYAQYALGILADLPVALSTPSVHTLYESSPNLARALVLGISQSGQAEDVRRVVADAAAQGALTVAITNDPASRLAQAAAFHIPLLAGEEISVAATKTYTSQLTVLAMLAGALGGHDEMQQELEMLPEWVAETLTLSEPVADWVQRYRYMERFAVIGRGYNYCTAFEISLKIKELCYIAGEEYSEADFRHGPIALIQPGFPIMVVAPRGKPLALLTNLLKMLAERKAEILVITNDEAASAYTQHVMTLPRSVPEWLTPIVAVIPGQRFAMHLAAARGHAIDRPRGLSKVTITE